MLCRYSLGQEAVRHDPSTLPLAHRDLHAGKTKVLTARVAYLVQEKGLPPSQICAVTFTNKAANEMRERLKKLIGVKQTDALVMGMYLLGGRVASLED